MSVCQKQHAQTSLDFLHTSAEAVARSSFDNNACVMYFRFYGWRHVCP